MPLSLDRLERRSPPAVAAFGPALLLLAPHAGCSSAPDRGAAPAVGAVASADSVVCAGANTVSGVDVSDYQAGYNFASAKAAGKSFAIVRVSDGLNYPDTSFDTFYPQVKAAGLVRGVYQYFEPTEDATAQANLVISKVGGALQPGDLPPTIDLEVNGITTAQLQTWLDTVEAALHVKPMIYVGYYFWTGNMGNPSGFGAYPLWIAGYVSCPTVPSEWASWKFWQYSDGTTNGTGGVDLDLFNGTLAELNALAVGAPAYAAQFVSQTYPYASAGPVAVGFGELVKGSITFKNVGTATWKAGVTKLAPIPRDTAGASHATTWLSTTRVSTVAGDVAPGAEGTFEWDLEGDSAGSFDEFYGLVEEGVTWFADAPLGGGPPDNQIEVKVQVAAPPDAGTTSAVDGGAKAGADGGTKPDADGGGAEKSDGGAKTNSDAGDITDSGILHLGPEDAAAAIDATADSGRATYGDAGDGVPDAGSPVPDAPRTGSSAGCSLARVSGDLPSRAPVTLIPFGLLLVAMRRSRHAREE